MYKGRLSFDDVKAWTIRVSMKLHVNLEARQMQQEASLKAQEAKESYEPFRWYMYLTDFVKEFPFVAFSSNALRLIGDNRDIYVFSKPILYRYSSSYSGFKDLPIVAKELTQAASATPAKALVKDEVPGDSVP
jgi:hypothetical protein